jgi:hypothetical protein
MHTVSRRPSDRAPARTAEQSVLPVFSEVTGKRVVVAGRWDAAPYDIITRADRYRIAVGRPARLVPVRMRGAIVGHRVAAFCGCVAE